MRKHNGKQLYGIQKILTTLKMGMNKELRKLSITNQDLTSIFSSPSFISQEKLLPCLNHLLRFFNS
jgi:hypothetical protein